MPLPDPEPGLVISYAYLWRHEERQGQREGREARPCVVVLAIEDRKGEKIVTVVPVTHRKPDTSSPALELPAKIKAHLHLDTDRSWILLDEVNQFTWPGFDLRPVPGNPTRYAFGFMPPRLFEAIRTVLLDRFLERRVAVTRRD